MRLKLFPSLNRIDEVIYALRLQVGPTKVQPGCVECSVYQECENPKSVLYAEEWRTWKHLERHIRSDRYVKILELMEMSTEMPELRFHGVGEIRGIEYVRQLRGCKE